ncbi:MULTISPECIES: hypothetical protein [unclassified Paenibacillus]|uniref:hypothetical protein n=1 Tax=unclassified Paenibacillus TaxID=185978 RepID=UPI00247415D7|nr:MULTISPECIES: hypothetical protein [unclassified Paenibacillus]MDH6427237.1 hypothetical protein [Paenibacillus sp. PastH-4]MDH6443267.1 hypothetical protein [Paenibacillus sp. PastF-4]MDH6526029.1 hypothetical protein [Paenibacillus sp. PastH-3]
MGYLDFKGLVKKVDLKADGDVNILLCVSGEELRGKIEWLHEMIGDKVTASFDSTVVNYNIEINARTEKPIRTYKVDNGIVSEVKPEGEQLSMDLGLPAEKIEIKQQPAEIDLSVIEEFIQSGLAPTYEDLDYDFVSFSNRLASGETYMKIASELGISSGKIVEKIDEYRKRVAPSAAAWHEWMQSQGVAPSAAAEVAPVTEDGGSAEDESGDIVIEEVDGSIQNEEGNGFTPDWESDSGRPAGDPAGSEGQPSSEEDEADEVDKEQLDAFILAERPIFAEVEYNGQPVPFPDLLEKRLKENKVWREIANENGMTSGQLSSRYNVYRKLAAKKMKSSGGAA